MLQKAKQHKCKKDYKKKQPKPLNIQRKTPSRAAIEQPEVIVIDDESFTPESFTPESFTPESFSPESFTPESFTPERGSRRQSPRLAQQQKWWLEDEEQIYICIDSDVSSDDDNVTPQKESMRKDTSPKRDSSRQSPQNPGRVAHSFKSIHQQGVMFHESGLKITIVLYICNCKLAKIFGFALFICSIIMNMIRNRSKGIKFTSIKSGVLHRFPPTT